MPLNQTKPNQTNQPGKLSQVQAVFSVLSPY